MKDQELIKSLTQLIDETLDELEELKKSKFAASEIDMKGPGDSLNDKNVGKDKDVNGGIDKKEKDEEDEKKKKEKEEADKKEMEKKEGVLVDEPKKIAAEKMGKEEGAKDEEDEKKKKEKEEADKKEMEKKEKEEADKKEYLKLFEKSVKESETLVKSFDARMNLMEDKLSKIAEAINKISDQPAAPKGITSRMVPLAKSADDKKVLSKSELSNKLLELKKSGQSISTDDIVKVDLGYDLDVIAKKYNL